MIKKIAILIGILIILAVLYGFGSQIYDSLNAENRLKSEEIEVERLKTKNEELKKQLQETESLTFIEKTARNKLNLARPNETIYLISPKLIEAVIASDSARVQIKIPNWQGWIRLFF